MKIALLGSAPSSCRLAPYKDQSWKMWGCSPGLFPVVERVDVWFELHRPEFPVVGDATKQVPWFTPEYVQWMANLAKCDVPVYMTEIAPEIPSSVRYPRERMLEKYGPYIFTSSLAWMFALALETEGVTEIGLWGVDMSATEEYGYQRMGCQMFMWMARQKGIKVTLPPESDLAQPPMLYGVGENNPMHCKLLARLKELQGRLAQQQQMRDSALQQMLFLQGAIDDLNYMLNTWTTQAPEFNVSVQRNPDTWSSADAATAPQLTVVKAG